MSKEQVSAFEVRPNLADFRHLTFDSEWGTETPFMLAKPVQDIGDLKFRWLTLDEDVTYELESSMEGEDGDVVLAHQRYERGVGDCVAVDDFVTSLVFSQSAGEALREILNRCGQLHPITVDQTKFYIFNCTRLIDAVDTTESAVRYTAKGRPIEFLNMSLRRSMLEGEMLFKLPWPESSESSSEPMQNVSPPLPIYATPEFIGVVEQLNLSGFEFLPVSA